ncbi:hypothetical protein DM01DRAFT_1190365 [Hesseltinella vesiculosa]|uniref:histidine kinase n=1 Tax=Hesseltinella vesiculosa TaxID=101127 RepID=A0A1X2GR98_9FUNG|nr:hypothetical protein DM01DRAFT_1190365 [Hesseltinella vesiculosa]
MEKLVRKRTENLVLRTKELESERARTQKLLKDLSAAKEIAETAAVSKQNFLANMSHEIRTPMNAVIGMSRMLMESDLPPDLYECAETIESSGNHLIALIDDILDYSKIESGRLTLERSKLDLTFVIESAMKLMSSNYLSKGLVLYYSIDPDTPIQVYGDLVRLRQIILNLLSNAFKFTERGSVSVCISLKNPLSEGGHDVVDEDVDEYQPRLMTMTPSADLDVNPMDLMFIYFSVCDTGIGIPKSKCKKLFKSFSQVDASTTRNFGGTGLGLAISRQLCRMMGGDMWVESEENQGSTFCFRVKLQVQEDSPTYGEQYQLVDLTKANASPWVICGRAEVRRQWHDLLVNIGMNPTTMTYQEAFSKLKAMDRSKKKSVITSLVVDMDLEVVDHDSLSTASFGAHNSNKQSPTTTTRPITSQLILETLHQHTDIFSWLPTLCVTDVRLRAKNMQFAQNHPPVFSSIPPSYRTTPCCPDAVITYPRSSKGNRTDSAAPDPSYHSSPVEQAIANHCQLIKPFKNSKLIHSLNILSSTVQQQQPWHPVTALNYGYDDAYTHNNLPMPLCGIPIVNCPRHRRVTSASPSCYHSSSPSSTTHPSVLTTKPTSLIPAGVRVLSPIYATGSPVLTELGATNITPSQPTPSSAASAGAGSTWDELASVRALLVDDNPVNQKVLNMMLRRMGLTCQVAQNGREALEAWIDSTKKNQPIQLIFMDVFMPEMDGLEATAKIRSDTNATHTIPYIIAMTACVMAGDKEKCLDAGMNGYVSKPVRKEELEASVHTFTQTCLASKTKKDDDASAAH